MNLAQGGLYKYFRVIPSVFFQQILRERAGIDADTDGDFPFLTGFGDLADFPRLADIAGIDADFVKSGLNRRQGQFVLEMDIGYEGFFDLPAYFFKMPGDLGIGYRQPDNFTPGVCQGVNLLNRGRDITGVGIGHGLNGYRETAPDNNLSNLDGPALASFCRKFIFQGNILTCLNLSYNLPFLRNYAMRSWSILIWLKRLAPLVVFVAGVLGYQYYRDSVVERHLRQDREIARLTARVWLASAVFREHPDKYIVYRDSVLAANKISTEQMNN